MGRLSLVKIGLLACGCVCGVGACQTDERKAAFTTRERSQAVQTTLQELPSRSAVADAGPRPSATPPPAPRRALCDGRLQTGKPFPNKRLSRAAAASHAAELTEKPALAKAGFVWVNFWAAWCAPCKEEIPRLLEWQSKLAASRTPLDVLFISLDDDARQLQQFLDGSSELRSTYWLTEGKERDEWLRAAGLDPDPELPIHLLVDKQGKIRCKVQGAVEDRDFVDLVKLLDG